MAQIVHWSSLEECTYSLTRGFLCIDDSRYQYKYRSLSLKDIVFVWAKKGRNSLRDLCIF